MNDALKSFRERLSLSLTDLSYVLGLSRSMLHKIESGPRSMNTIGNFRLAYLLEHEDKTDVPIQVRLNDKQEVEKQIEHETESLARLQAELEAVKKAMEPEIRRQAGLAKLSSLTAQNPELFPLSNAWKEMIFSELRMERALTAKRDFLSIQKKIVQKEAWIQFLKNPDNQYFSVWEKG